MVDPSVVRKATILAQNPKQLHQVIAEQREREKAERKARDEARREELIVQRVNEFKRVGVGPLSGLFKCPYDCSAIVMKADRRKHVEWHIELGESVAKGMHAFSRQQPIG